MKKAFTLIELLVVVLIIGILAAVALPQYQVAVQKAKDTNGMICANALLRAIQEYRLANGEWPPEGTNISALAEISIPSTYYVNRRNTSTETAVLVCESYEMFVNKGGQEVLRFCRATSTNKIQQQSCKNLTGTNTPGTQGDWLLYEYQ